MSRAERRREERKQGKANIERKYTFTEKELEYLAVEALRPEIQQCKQTTARVTTEIVLSAVIVAMKGEFGFGDKRLKRMAKGIIEQFKLIKDGNITNQELIKCANDFGYEKIKNELKLIIE
jgi:hypothetical protein